MRLLLDPSFRSCKQKTGSYQGDFLEAEGLKSTIAHPAQPGKDGAVGDLPKLPTAASTGAKVTFCSSLMCSALSVSRVPPLS